MNTIKSLTHFYSQWLTMASFNFIHSLRSYRRLSFLFIYAFAHIQQHFSLNPTKPNQIQIQIQIQIKWKNHGNLVVRATIHCLICHLLASINFHVQDLLQDAHSFDNSVVDFHRWTHRRYCWLFTAISCICLAHTLDHRDPLTHITNFRLSPKLFRIYQDSRWLLIEAHRYSPAFIWLLVIKYW